MSESVVLHDKITVRAIADLKPYEKNARTHDEGQIAQIAASIKEFGFTNPVLIDADDRIIAGHGRAEAAKQLGMAEVPCILLSNLTQTQLRAYVLADNQIALQAGWNAELLAGELKDLKAEGFDLGIAGFDAGELERMLDEEPMEGVAKFVPTIFSMQQIVDAAFEHFRKNGFPYRNHPLFWCMQELNKLSAITGEALLTTTRGYQIADTFNKHRYHATAVGKRSPLDLFNDDKGLRVALEKQLDMQGTIPNSYFALLGLASNTQACSNFRPGFAAFMYREHCSAGARILDTSAGYGGRLVGFMAAQIENSHYIGIDPNVTTQAGNRAMVEALGYGTRCTLIEKPAEDVSDEIESESCDFSFTSPPYFVKEIYSDAPTQSRERYKEIGAWVEGFLQPLMALQYRVLKSGCSSVMNIADVRIKGEEYPLAQLTIEAGEKAGFTFVERREFALGGRMGVDLDEFPPSEPVLIFSKP